jgi:predicted Holliday junction resolvase-like endonuclease
MFLILTVILAVLVVVALLYYIFKLKQEISTLKEQHIQELQSKILQEWNQKV